MSTILDMKQLMNILSKHAAKSLLLLILTSFLIACAEEEEKEEEPTPNNPTFAEVTSPILAKGEFKTNPDLKNFAEPVNEESKCNPFKDIEDEFVAETGDAFIAHYMVDISTQINNCRVRNEMQFEVTNFPFPTTNGEVQTLTKDVGFLEMLSKFNERIASPNNLVTDASVFMNRAIAHTEEKKIGENTVDLYLNATWLADNANEVISSVSFIGSALTYFDFNLGLINEFSIVSTQESENGVFRVNCRLVMLSIWLGSEDGEFACTHYRYDVKNGDFDAGRFVVQVGAEDGKLVMESDTAQTIQLLGNFDKTNEQHVYSYLKKAGYDATVNVQPTTLTKPDLKDFSHTTKAFDVDGVFEEMASAFDKLLQKGALVLANNPFATGKVNALLNKNYTHRSETDDAVIKFYGKEAISAAKAATN